MYSLSKKQVNGKLPVAIWGLNTLALYQTSKSLIKNIKPSDNSTQYKIISGKITKQLFYLSKQLNSISKLNVQLDLNQIKQFKIQTYNTIMRFLVQHYQGGQKKYLEIKIIYMIFFLAKMKTQICTKAEQKSYIAEWLQQYNLFFHQENPKNPYTKNLHKNRLNKLNSSQIQKLQSFYESIMNFRQQMILRTLQNIIDSNEFSPQIQNKALLAYSVIYGRILFNDADPQTKKQEQKQKNDPAKQRIKKQLDAQYIYNNPQIKTSFEKQLLVLLKIQIQLILFKDKQQIKKLSQNSWAQYLKLHLLYVYPMDSITHKLDIIHQFLHTNRYSSNLSLFQKYFIQQISDKNANLEYQFFKQLNFQKLYSILPPYLCALIGHKILVKDIVKQTIIFDIKHCKQYLESLQKEAFNQASGMGWQTFRYMMGIYQINQNKKGKQYSNSYQQQNWIWAQEIYNVLLGFLSYDLVESQQAFSDIQSKVLDLFQVDLNPYAITYIQNMFTLQSKKLINIYTLKLLLLFLRLTMSHGKDHYLIKKLMNQISYSIQRTKFDYNLIRQIEVLQNEMKSQLSNQNSKKINYTKYKCYEIDIKNLEIIKDKLTIFFDLRQIDYQSNYNMKINLLIPIMNKKHCIDITWQIFRLLIQIIEKYLHSKNNYLQSKQSKGQWQNFHKNNKMIDQKYQKHYRTFQFNNSLINQFFDKVKIFIYNFENNKKIDETYYPEISFKIYQKLKDLIYDHRTF